MDEQNINYDMDSEDELAEANGEDLDDDPKSEDEESDLNEDEENKGFIVEDDYLSDSELDLSQKSNPDVVMADKERRKAII